MINKTLKIKGMHCTGCAFNIEGNLEDIGVTSRADYHKGTVTVSYDPDTHTVEAIHAAIKKAGYSVL